MEDWAPGLFDYNYKEGDLVLGEKLNMKNFLPVLTKVFVAIERAYPSPGNLFVYAPRHILEFGNYPTLAVPDKYRTWLLEKFNFTSVPKKRPCVCFHILTDAPYSMSRNHNFKEWDNCISILAKEDVDIYRVGIPGHRLTCRNGNIHDLTIENLTPSQSIAVISMCDVYVGGDTGMTHAASALGKKIVGVWGDITHMLRDQSKPNNIQPDDWNSGPYVPEDRCIVFRRSGGSQKPVPVVPSESIYTAIKELLSRG
jgi:ADP-heptose:LPS heptosyltransferase